MPHGGEMLSVSPNDRQTLMQSRMLLVLLFALMRFLLWVLYLEI
jgi:hypothetical protein